MSHVLESIIATNVTRDGEMVEVECQSGKLLRLLRKETITQGMLPTQATIYKKTAEVHSQYCFKKPRANSRTP